MKTKPTNNFMVNTFEYYLLKMLDFDSFNLVYKKSRLAILRLHIFTTPPRSFVERSVITIKDKTKSIKLADLKKHLLLHTTSVLRHRKSPRRRQFRVLPESSANSHKCATAESHIQEERKICAKSASDARTHLQMNRTQ